MKTLEPIGTWTSLLFLSVGAVALIPATILENHILFISVIPSSIALAIGSFMFHFNNSEKNTFWHRLDEGSMYTLLLSLIMYSFDLYSFAWILVFISASIIMIGLVGDIDSFIAVPILSSVVLLGIAIEASIIGAITVGIVTIGAGVIRSIHPHTDAIHGIWHATATIAIVMALISRVI